MPCCAVVSLLCRRGWFRLGKEWSTTIAIEFMQDFDTSRDGLLSQVLD